MREALFNGKMTRLVKSQPFVMWLCLALIFLYCIPYSILGGDASLNINDNMDSVLVWYKTIIDNGLVFASNNTPVAPFMNGITRVSFPSELNFTLLWFWIFGPLGGYIFERWLFAVVGFCGMYLLLRKFVIPDHKYNLIAAGVSLTFSLLPHWPYGGLSVVGLPLLFYAFLNLRSANNRFYNWLIICLYPFYSSLVLSGFFFMLLILMLIGIDLFHGKKIKKAYLMGFFVLGFCYVLTHYRLFLSFFIHPDFVSHRVDFVLPSSGLAGTVNFFIDRITIANQAIIFSVVLAGILMWNYKEVASKYKFTLYFIIISAGLSSLMYSKYAGAISTILFQLLPINLERVSWLYPLFWSILFAISLAYIYNRLRIGKYLVVILLTAQLGYDFAHHELVVSALSLKAGEKQGEVILKVDPSYKEFFASKQFEQIAKYIGKKKESYRVLSLGIHPSISQFNGFYTVDGYSANYDRLHKIKFRKIIKGELDKNTVLKEYYDTWGSRVYLFVGKDIGYVNLAGNNLELTDLDFSTQSMKEMGATYIFSAVKINTTSDPEYKFLRKFQHRDSAWDIYLYEII